jgi:hypothetical protein
MNFKQRKIIIQLAYLENKLSGLKFLPQNLLKCKPFNEKIQNKKVYRKNMRRPA